MQKPTFLQYALAWLVHAFTASGIIFGFLSIIAISNGDFRMAMVWLIVTLFVDGIDGTFARLFKVQEVLPNFDGNSIDHVIDFATYAIIPAYFFYETNVLPDSPMLKWIGICAILLSSTYYYGKTSYVTDDLHFEGFPVMWNFVIFYIYFIFHLDPVINLIVVIILAVLHFIPWKYPYPSRTKEFRFWNISITAIGFITAILILWKYPTTHQVLEILAIVVLLYFFSMTMFKTFLFKKT